MTALIADSVSAMMCAARAACVSIRYATRVALDTTMLKYAILDVGGRKV